MPMSALAPLASTWREIEFSPCRAVTEYIMVMSAGPTYGATSPEATEDMMSLGTPIGSARMAGDTSEAPPDPPAEITPTTSAWRRSQLAKASAIAVTEVPRSGPNTAPPPRACLRAISWPETSQDDALPLLQ